MSPVSTLCNEGREESESNIQPCSSPCHLLAHFAMKGGWKYPALFLSSHDEVTVWEQHWSRELTGASHWTTEQLD